MKGPPTGTSGSGPNASSRVFGKRLTDPDSAEGETQSEALVIQHAGGGGSSFARQMPARTSCTMMFMLKRERPDQRRPPVRGGDIVKQTCKGLAALPGRAAGYAGGAGTRPRDHRRAALHAGPAEVARRE
ncbi:hypothetical protein TSOC_001150 [Tetrabaena socialis]|uniref:Uncharacterized protein n=1 Tax=Tetrabaena socialis TaxID=47790 RepID=A0A2J8AHE8_9CHLO|nr:hypothetical protein TSOC_001150 [Tetrabaena socialis]|eukprot:PNH11942.1 hypothetical protein TSOC_001150 [Tetrabaena socialis]